MGHRKGFKDNFPTKTLTGHGALHELSTQLALYSCGFRVHRLNQPQIEKTWPKKSQKVPKKAKLEFATHWALYWTYTNKVVCRHPLLYPACVSVGYMQMLQHFIEGTWASVDFGVHRGSGTDLPPTSKDNCTHWWLNLLSNNLVWSPISIPSIECAYLMDFCT